MDPITIDALKTIGGQAAVILGTVQGIKLAIPWLRKPGDLQDNVIQSLTVALGIGLSWYYTAAAGLIPAIYNGLVAALASMKGYDFASTGAAATKKAIVG